MGVSWSKLGSRVFCIGGLQNMWQPLEFRTRCNILGVVLGPRIWKSSEYDAQTLLEATQAQLFEIFGLLFEN